MVDLIFCPVQIADAPYAGKFIQRDAVHIRTAPHRELAVPVLSCNECMDVLAVHIQLLTDQILESRRIKNRTGSDHPLLRESGFPERHFSQDIHRVRYDHQDAFAFHPFDLRDDPFHDPGILLHQVKPCLPRLLVRPCRDDHHGCVRDILVCSRMDVHGMSERDAVADIHRLPFSLRLDCIDQDEL